MTLKIQIYTDGSYYDEYLLGGYAALLLAKEDGRVVKEKLVAVAGKQTNPMRAELAAVILGLRQVKGEGVRITVFSDCKTMIDCLQRKTIPDTHCDLWDKLLALAGKHDVRWHWVRGHDGQPENMRVNDAARNAVRKVKRGRNGKIP